MNQSEKNDILDQHKKVYDGFATQYAQPNTQPLYVQDFANDKGGITVSNKGDVKSYTNMNINEDVFSGSKFEPEETFEEEKYVSVGEQLDMIGDGPTDMEHGTFDDDCPHCGGIGRDEFSDEECEWCGGTGFEDKGSHHFDLEVEPEFNDVDDLDIDELDIDIIEPLQEQVNKTLDMFRRFKNY